MITLSVGPFRWVFLERTLNPFQCGGKLFKVPYWHLKKYSPALLPLGEPNADETRGASDDTAIPIDDLVSAEEFVIFLDFFYNGFVPLNHEQLLGVAHILSKHTSQQDPNKRVV